MVTCDGAGASYELVSHLDELASRRGRQVTWSVGWQLGKRGKLRERRADAGCADRGCGYRNAGSRRGTSPS